VAPASRRRFCLAMEKHKSPARRWLAFAAKRDSSRKIGAQNDGIYFVARGARSKFL
jgi:hypothetical protein